jgi:hypothetical protein
LVVWTVTHESRANTVPTGLKPGGRRPRRSHGRGIGPGLAQRTGRGRWQLRGSFELDTGTFGPPHSLITIEGAIERAIRPLIAPEEFTAGPRETAKTNPAD